MRRTGEVAALLADAGVIAIVSLVSPFRGDRQRVRELHVERRLPFAEVFVDTPLDVCEERDPKGMYAMARAGELTGFTGVDDPYEEPISPELHLRHGEGSATEHAAAVLALAAATGRPTEKM